MPPTGAMWEKGLSMLYVWEVEFQEHFTNMASGEWDKDLTNLYRVVAEDYEEALSTAKNLALSGSWVDDVDDVRLISIKQDIYIDAVAKKVAA